MGKYRATRGLDELELVRGAWAAEGIVVSNAEQPDGPARPEPSLTADLGAFFPSLYQGVGNTFQETYPSERAPADALWRCGSSGLREERGLPEPG